MNKQQSSGSRQSQSQSGAKSVPPRGPSQAGTDDALEVEGGVVNRSFSSSNETPAGEADVETGADLHLTRGTTRNEEMSDSAYDDKRARQSREADDKL